MTGTLTADTPRGMTRGKALAAIHVAAVLFGMTGVFGALIQADAFAVTAGRAGFAVLALGLLAVATGRSLRAGIGRRRAGGLVAAGLVLALHWVTFFHAVKVGGIAVATLGFASFPAFITLFEALALRESVQRLEWFLLAVVSAGLVLVVPSFDWRDGGTVGLMWGLLSGMSFAGLAIINRYVAAGIDAVQVAFWQNVVVALCVLPFASAALAGMSAVDWAWTALLGVMCTGLSHYLFVSSLQALNARTAGLVIALEPVYAIAAAWLLFAEQPSARMLVGAAMIVAAILASGLRKPPAEA